MQYLRQSSSRLALAAVVTAAFVLGGCAAKHEVLAPAPNAILANQGRAAKATADGVTVIVQPNSWNGTPADLANRITPLKVTIRNGSGQPLRIRYENFSLVGPNDTNYAALPPYNIHGTAYLSKDTAAPPGSARLVLASMSDSHGATVTSGRTVVQPDFDWDDYYVAPYWSYTYPGVGFWPYAWPPDYGYYYGYYPYLTRVNLPTQSMLRKAIPEGVIGPGGMVSGFLYFQRVSDLGDGQQVNCVVRLENARTGKYCGEVRVPMIVHK